MQQWSFGIQRELSPSMAFEVRYVGNHSTGMYRGNDLSQPNMTPALLAEFQQAATNLSVCSANRTNCTGSAIGRAPLRQSRLGRVRESLPILERDQFSDLVLLEHHLHQPVQRRSARARASSGTW